MNHDEQMQVMSRKQNEIAHDLVQMLRASGVALLKVGMRTGKSRIQELVADKFEASEVFLFSNLWSDKDFQGMVVHVNELPLADKVPDNALVILDEPWVWAAAQHLGTYSTYERARALGLPVLAVGSNGMGYASEPRWASLPGLSYNTWDINPTMPRDGQLLKSLYARNPTNAARDYEAF